MIGGNYHKEVIHMVDKEKRSPLFHMRMPVGLYDWLRGYSKRTGKPMAAIIKDYLFELQRKDEHDQQRKGTTGGV